jgi:hypothetical protein
LQLMFTRNPKKSLMKYRWMKTKNPTFLQDFFVGDERFELPTLWV